MFEVTPDSSHAFVTTATTEYLLFLYKPWDANLYRGVPPDEQHCS